MPCIGARICEGFVMPPYRYYRGKISKAIACGRAEVCTKHTRRETVHEYLRVMYETLGQNEAELHTLW